MKPKYFQPHEVSGLSDKLVEMLDKARDIAGVPVVITSGYRAPDRNALAGGVSNSLHCKGLAADLRTPKSQTDREKLCFALGAAGFKQIGLYNGHIHVELDPKDSYAIWTGVSH